MLSAFEGGESSSADGQSRFGDIVITGKDEPLVRSYIDQAVQQAHTRLERMIASVTTTDSEKAVSWTMRGDTLWPSAKQGSILNKHIEETLVAWAMSRWLEFKGLERAKFYAEMFNNYISLAEQNISTSEAPKKRRTFYGE